MLWVQSLGQEDSLEEEMTTHSVLLPGKFYRQQSLAGYSALCGKELDTTEWLSAQHPQGGEEARRSSITSHPLSVSYKECASVEAGGERNLTVEKPDNQHHFMVNRWGKVETVTDFIFLGFKITEQQQPLPSIQSQHHSHKSCAFFCTLDKIWWKWHFTSVIVLPKPISTV